MNKSKAWAEEIYTILKRDYNIEKEKGYVFHILEFYHDMGDAKKIARYLKKRLPDFFIKMRFRGNKTLLSVESKSLSKYFVGDGVIKTRTGNVDLAEAEAVVRDLQKLEGTKEFDSFILYLKRENPGLLSWAMNQLGD
jgi:hypothetical protein